MLPLVNPSADADDHYFSDGLTDEVITNQSRVGALRSRATPTVEATYLHGWRPR